MERVEGAVGGASGGRGGALARSIVTESAAAVDTMPPGERASSAVGEMRASGAQSGWEARSLAAGSSVAGVVREVGGGGGGGAVKKEAIDICVLSVLCCLFGVEKGESVGLRTGVGGGRGEGGGEGAGIIVWGGAVGLVTTLGRKKFTKVHTKVHNKVAGTEA